MTERAAPFYCPYCGDEDLRPHEEGHGAWLCGACRRAFTLKYLGLVFPANPQAPGASSSTSSSTTPDPTVDPAPRPTPSPTPTNAREAT